jgi:hypothetical protein
MTWSRSSFGVGASDMVRVDHPAPPSGHTTSQRAMIDE